MTGIKNTTERYGWGAASLHWVIALLVIGLLGVGLYMVRLTPGTQMFQIYALHKSVGIVVLTLLALRVGWKLSNTHPLPLATHAAWEKKLAALIHVLLYVFLLAMPLSGWIMSSAKGFSVSVFGLFTLPDLVKADKGIADLAVQIHQFTAYALIAAVLLHAAGAVKHAIIDRDKTLARMVPFLRIGALAALLFLPAQAFAQAATMWTIDPAKSRITFEGKQMGAPFEGEFKDFNGTIAFDPANLDASHVTVAIKTASIGTGSPDRDSAIVGKDWFDVAAFPESIFTADKFEKIDATHFVALGSLKIRDVSVPVKLPFTLTIEPGAGGQRVAAMTGEAELNRFDFKLGAAEFKDEASVGAAVKVTVRVFATDTPLVAEKH